ncbi:hypothetical protein HOD75_00140 [archaeon]|jgi:hypothetical protein|nr:hypothetical protein [Candidatus Woesearchaeota archaeon]MBT4136061.1 hypothetical protein [archaeon]MBT4241286.1 hypothetical protein [archaeon]MBT4418108.1 hypothetical protein [archaeon]
MADLYDSLIEAGYDYDTCIVANPNNPGMLAHVGGDLEDEVMKREIDNFALIPTELVPRFHDPESSVKRYALFVKKS